MSAPLSVVTDLWNVLALLRDRPDAKEEQKAAFRLLVVTLGVSPLLLEATAEGLTYQGISVAEETPGAVVFGQQMLLHGVGAIEVPEGAGAAPILSLLRALAAPKGTYRHIQEFITAVGEPGASRFKITPPTALAPRPVAPRPAEPVQGSAPPPRPSTPASSRPSVELGPGIISSEAGDMVHFFSSQHATIDQLAELSLRVEQDPDDPNIGAILNELVGAVDGAVQQGNWEGILRAAARVVRVEQGVAARGQGVRPYGAALKRILPHRTLEKLVRFLPQPEFKADALLVVGRMGESATDVLLESMTAAPTIGERRHYFDALVQSAHGSELVVNTLRRGEWFVVRNVAELCGELKLEGAVPVLAGHLTHADERVRKAAILALAKIGSAATVEPLRSALKDATPSVRMQAVMAIDGRQSRALALRLVTMLEDETVPEVQREICYAVGRSGLPEGVQALIRMASPGGKVFNKKATQPRVWAIEGLRLAGGGVAQGALDGLLQDGEKEVREAAEKALKGMK